MERLECRSACGACCIAPSISSPLPGMPDGKPAGTPCANLDSQYRCRVFGKADRPAFCAGLQPSEEMCGTTREHALRYLLLLERATAPEAGEKQGD